MLTLIFLGLYLVPVYLIQPKLALANYETLTGSSKKKANEKAFWQSLLWPVMLIMLRGHKVIEEKKTTELALAEARRVIATDNARTNPEMAEWDRNAGISPGHAVISGSILDERKEITCSELRYTDLGRRMEVKDKYKKTERGYLKSFEFKDLGQSNLDLGGGWVFVHSYSKITFLD